MGIDTGRLKIVSVREGSVIVDVIIQEELNENGTNSTNATYSNSTSDLDELLEELKEGLENDMVNLTAPLLNFDI